MVLGNIIAWGVGLEIPFEIAYNHPSEHHRGVAQLIARSVWDREVEGLSPFTPTK